MWRYLIGVFAGAVLAVGGVLLWRSGARAERASPSVAGVAGAASSETASALPDPPVASDKTREQRRFARYDKDKDGRIAREEYLASRRKAFTKLDANGDGRLSFDEWVIKATDKFTQADADRSGVLTPEEFATTRVVRKAKPKCACPPAPAEADDDR